MIDTHAHLYDAKYEREADEVIGRSQAAGLKAIYMPNLSLETITPMLNLQEQYPTFLYPMLGLHPCEVEDDYLTQLTTMSEYLTVDHPFVAIGEIGLDYYHSRLYQKEQNKALNIQLQWAAQYDLPVVLHARNSLDDVIEAVAQSGLSRGIFHCFDGDINQAKKIVDLGFHLGIGGIITFPKNNLSDVVENIPLEHLVLETDAPYLTPVPYRGKRNEPTYLPYIAQRIAVIKNLPIEQVVKTTTQSARDIFKYDVFRKNT